MHQERPRPPSQASAAQKVVIRPLKVRPQLPADFELSNWSKLREAVHAIQGARPVESSLEELYRSVEDMCQHGLGSKLYAQLQEECDRHAQNALAQLAARGSLPPPAFLDQCASLWETHCEQLLLTRQIFLYLDRTHVLQASSEARSIFDLGLAYFRTHLAHHGAVQEKLLHDLLALIESGRGGAAIDELLVRRLVRVFSSLGLYASVFQPAFLTAATEHYRALGDRLLAQLLVPAYLLAVEQRLHEEGARCDAYLEPATRRPLLAVVEHCLLERHLAQILDLGLDAMLESDARADLARLRALCARVHATPALRAAFKLHVRREGLKLVSDEARQGELVGALVRWKARLDALVAEALGGSEAFAGALREGFEHFINQKGGKPAELIARYMDGLMRGGGAGKGSEEEVEAALDAALALFRFIHGKDVFEAFYKKDLAKRLLLSRSVSVETEKAAIAKLKVECGSQFTTKLEGMFKDVELSRDVCAGFRAEEAALDLQGLDLHVNILTSGFWPSYPSSPCELPPALARAQEGFSDYYLHKHSGRRLVWQDALSSCVLRVKFDCGVRELSVSLFQAVVLLRFEADQGKAGREEEAARGDKDAESNARGADPGSSEANARPSSDASSSGPGEPPPAPAPGWLSVPALQRGTGLEQRELMRTLHSLSCGRDRILLKHPPDRELSDSDAFAFNRAFHSRAFRVRVNALQLRETAKEVQRTNDAVSQDRAHQVDAAVVRIMKTRRSLEHKTLVAELGSQLRFPVRGADLKKRIESLIDREYLARDEGNPNIYTYLA